MKIIVRGNVTKRFTCERCGCVFEANVGEYAAGQHLNEKYYYCECPMCKKTVYIYE